MKKIVFGITSLGLGGAERVLVDLANRLVNEYEVTIFMLYGKGEFLSQLKPEVKVETVYPFSYQELSKWQKRIKPLQVLCGKKKIYRKWVEGKYDVEIAFLEGPITRIFSVKNTKVKKIAWIHNDISRVFGKGWKAKLKKNLDKKIYGKYDCLAFVSKDNLEQFDKVYGDIRNDLLQPISRRVIYNYIEPDTVLEKAEEKIEEIWEEKLPSFATVARLVKQKGIDRLIKVHAKLIKKGYKHVIYVIGEGTEREKLEKLRKENGVESTFFLLGKKENPYPYIKKADYFCLLSQFEGYGMVLEEAKILQKPIVITDTAAREAVLGYENSRILENTEAGIEKGLQDILRENLKYFGVQEKAATYDNQKILEKVKKVIEEPKKDRNVKPKGDA